MVVKNCLSDSKSVMGKPRFFFPPLLLLSDVLIVMRWKSELGGKRFLSLIKTFYDFQMFPTPQ